MLRQSRFRLSEIQAGFRQTFSQIQHGIKSLRNHKFRFSDRSDRAGAAKKPRRAVHVCAMKNSQEVSIMRFTKAGASVVVLALSVLLLVPSALFGQSATKGAVSGTVTDASSAVLSRE